MLKRITFILLVVLLAGCSKSVVEPGCGGYSFGEIYLYMNGGIVDMHELTIAVPPEEGYTDIEVVTGRLLKFDYLEGDDKNISLEFPGPFEANPEDPWMTRQTIRVKCSANPGIKSRSCKYRIYAYVADGVMADVTFVQRGRQLVRP